MEPSINEAPPENAALKAGGMPPTEQDEADDSVSQYVTFFIADECFAFPLASVLEIIRVPDTMKVPLAPRSLLGLANLRGSVLPILDLRRVLALLDLAHSDSTRVIVTDVGNPVGLVVDRVAQVLSVDRAKIESSEGVQSTVKADLMTGVVKDVGGRSLIQLFDVEKCISLDFASVVNMEKTRSTAALEAGDDRRESEEEVDDGSLQIVSFVVDKQEYAFPIADVEEIVRLPDSISHVPRAEHTVLGLISLRNRLLPLVSMRRIFSLHEAENTETERILVVTLVKTQGRHESVGIVVDQVREVLRVEKNVQDQMPALLSRNGMESRVETVCRLDDGKRLVSVLSSKALFENNVVQAAVETSRKEEDAMQQDAAQDLGDEEDDHKLVVFQLAHQEFGVMVEAVQEIIRVPAEMSRVPKTQSFIQGMVNLRGSVLPVLDMRVRFGMDRVERNDRQRILVFNQGGTCTGFIVDSVTEVLRLTRNTLEKAPRLSDEQTRIMGRVANLKDQKRMIQILDVQELITDDEMHHGLSADGPAPTPAAEKKEKARSKKESRPPKPARTGA
jgi:purine-binding chemotaxis protein CheW